MNTIENNNILIAQFMGGKLSESATAINWGLDTPQNGSNQHDCYHLEYHTSWNWLIPVGIKCLEVGLSYRHHPFITEDIKNAASFFEMNRLYNEIVKFIKWYNENK